MSKPLSVPANNILGFCRNRSFKKDHVLSLSGAFLHQLLPAAEPEGARMKSEIRALKNSSMPEHSGATASSSSSPKLVSIFCIRPARAGG